jgi:hypothetical protein
MCEVKKANLDAVTSALLAQHFIYSIRATICITPSSNYPFAGRDAQISSRAASRHLRWTLLGVIKNAAIIQLGLDGRRI